MPSTNLCSEPPTAVSPESLERLAVWLDEAEYVLVGMGAGLSASAGLNYVDPDFFRRHFPAHAALGLRPVWEAVTGFWDITPDTRLAYWGYWARHIRVMRYEPPALPPYVDLARLLHGRDWFIASTNADGQARKLGLDEARIYTPQGDYALFQCALPCREQVYDNRAFVDAMLAPLGEGDTLIREKDVPRCPHCGRFLVPNLRKDEHFVDALHREGYPRYRDFLERAAGGRLLLLELGVGFNTPGIIRYPFEHLTEKFPAVRLARINLTQAAVPPRLGDRALGLACDIGAALRRLAGMNK